VVPDLQEEETKGIGASPPRRPVCIQWAAGSTWSDERK
jgi:hypothetical protein